jgi:hypothetical protein
MKLKSFCTTKEIVTRLTRPPTEWEKIFGSYTSDMGLITRILQEAQKIKLKMKINDPMNKGKWTELRHFKNTWRNAQHPWSWRKCKSKPGEDSTSLLLE